MVGVRWGHEASQRFVEYPDNFRLFHPKPNEKPLKGFRRTRP